MTASVAPLVAAVLLAGMGVLGAFGVHAAAIALAGSVLAGLRRNDATDALADPAPLRVAALVVAHDEERVVARSVGSLVAQDHPSDRLSVFVVADRCTDETAERARAAGATVFERADGPPGKSAAVAYGVTRIASEGPFDALVVFDADNVVDRGFVAAIARRIASGERAVQGLVDAQNPAASWVAAASSLGFWAIAGTRQAPRERLGLTTPPMGTGFAMPMRDAEAFLARTDSLTDDVELAAVLALAGIRVAYEPRARLTDEKPVTLRTAVSQRHRWMQGRFSVAGKYAPPLLRAALSAGLPFQRRRALVDATIELVSPSIFFVAVTLAAFSALSLALGTAVPELPYWLARGPGGIGLTLAAVLYVLPLPSLARFRPPPFAWLCYLVQPLYLILSVPLGASGIVTRGERVWKRTPKG